MINPLSWCFPFSGDVKDISPVTSWFSPQYEVNIAGNPQVEKKVITDVASYGRQLNKIMKAVLELAEGEAGEATEALRQLSDEIDAVKNQTLCEKIEADLCRLKKQDKKAYDTFISRL